MRLRYTNPPTTLTFAQLAKKSNTLYLPFCSFLRFTLFNYFGRAIRFKLSVHSHYLDFFSTTLQKRYQVQSRSY